MVLGFTCAIVGTTLVAALLLLGRFTLLVCGFVVIFSAALSFEAHWLTQGQEVAVLAAALGLIVAGRPSALRRRDRDRLRARLRAHRDRAA